MSRLANVRARYAINSGDGLPGKWEGPDAVACLNRRPNPVPRRRIKVDDNLVVKRSTTPFCDAARVLLAEGIKPDTVLIMRHDSSVADALRSTVGSRRPRFILGQRARWTQ